MTIQRPPARGPIARQPAARPAQPQQLARAAAYPPQARPSMPSSGLVIPPYQDPDPEVYKQRAERTGASRFDSVLIPGTEQWKAKQGPNYIRLIDRGWKPYPGDYAFELYIHQRIGIDTSDYVCLAKQFNKPCPACEAREEFKRAGEEEQAGLIAPRLRWLCYVIDRQESPDVPQVWMFSNRISTNLASLCRNPRDKSTIFPTNIDNGYDLTVVRTGTGLNTSYDGFQFDREPSPMHANPTISRQIRQYVWEHPIPDLLQEYSYEYINGKLSGTAPERDELDVPAAAPEQEEGGNGYDAEGRYEEEPSPFTEGEGEDQGEGEYAAPEEPEAPPIQRRAPSARPAPAAAPQVRIPRPPRR